MMIPEVTCADFPCKNNGTCVDTGTLYICACASGTGRTVKMNLKCLTRKNELKTN